MLGRMESLLLRGRVEDMEEVAESLWNGPDDSVGDNIIKMFGPSPQDLIQKSISYQILARSQILQKSYKCPSFSE